jgi:hypothetical protein
VSDDAVVETLKSAGRPQINPLRCSVRMEVKRIDKKKKKERKKERTRNPL